MTLDKNKFFFILMSFYPLSIIIGPLISLINTIIIILFYSLFFFKEQHYKFIFKDKNLKILLVIYLYLIANTLISLSYEVGLSRNLGFIRLIFLFVAINYFFYIYPKSSKVFYVWTIIFIIFVMDVYVERFTGSNVFGWGPQEIDGIFQPYGSRVMSFFKDEPIAGSFIYGLIFIIIGCLFILQKKKINYFYLFLAFIFLLSIVITGERSNTIKVMFGIFLFILIIDFMKLKTKLLLLTILIGSIIVVVSNSGYLKNRYVGQLYYFIAEKDSKNLQNSLYFKLYRSGINVFKNYPIMGVGNKNYRVESCGDVDKVIKYNYKCTTHPHQIYIELFI